jgi:SAM-dependent methyltransferase
MSERPSLSGKIVDEYYVNHYERVHSSGALGGAATIMHRALEAGRGRATYPLTLELGAGNFEHLPYVEHGWDRYVASDLRVPEGTNLYEQLQRGEGPPGLEFMTVDATALPFEDHSVDRVVAGCLMIHLWNPLDALAEWQRVCRPEGAIDFLVPCDPGIVSRTFRRVISQRTAEKNGVPGSSYKLVSAIDHVNPFGRVLTLSRAAIEPDRRLEVRYFPFKFLPSWNLNAFAIFSVTPRA